MPTDRPYGPLRGRVLLFQPFHFDLLGGVDVVVDNLWRGLEGRQPGLATIGIQDWAKSGDATDDEGRRFLHLNLPEPPDKGALARLRYLVTLCRRLPTIVRELHSRNIEIVNFHFPTLNIFPVALIKRLGLWKGRIVLSFHGSDVLAINPKRTAWKLIASQVDEVTACSKALAKQVETLRLFDSPPRAIYNGIDIPRFLSRASEEPLTVPAPYILNVGTFVSNKGQDILLEAFAHVTRTHPQINLVYVGGADNGVWLAGLRRRTAELGLGERVHFLENQPQTYVATLMRHAICLAHSSHREGLPLVLIEAGASRLPIVSSRVGGIPEIVESADHGVLVEPGDYSALASAIISILHSPSDASQRATRLRQRISDLFSAEAMTSNYMSTYANN